MDNYSQLIHNVYACEWAPSPLLFLSDNVFSALIYYSHLVPTIAGLLLAFIVWKQNRKDLINRLFIFLSLMFATWTMLDLLLWADVNPNHIMFAWTLQAYIDPLIYIAAFYLIYVFVRGTDMPLYLKSVFVLGLLPVIIFAPTHYTLEAFDYTNCNREAIEGVLWQYVYVFEFLILIGIALFSAFSLWRIKVREERLQLILLAGGLVLFLAAFSFGNIVGSVTENWSVAQYGLFGMPVFLGAVLYLIARFKTFRIQVLGTSILVVVLWLLLFSILFLQTIEVARPVIVVTLVLFGIIGLLLIRSIRQEIKIRQELERLSSDLEMANSQQVTLIHFITHQIKGFVTKSRNIFSLIKEGDFGPIPESMQPMVDEGFKSDTKGIATIQEILNAANIKSGKVEYRKDPFDLKALIEEVIRDLRTASDAKGLTIVSDMGSEPIMYPGDKGQLLNALKNIIDNSIKYTPKGEVRIKLTREDKKIRLIVEDTGVGITKEDMENLFTEGGHGANSTKINVESTGFGLYIVKSIIEAHGGKVWAESEGADKGSRFTVELPV